MINKNQPDLVLQKISSSVYKTKKGCQLQKLLAAYKKNLIVQQIQPTILKSTD